MAKRIALSLLLISTFLNAKDGALILQTSYVPFSNKTIFYDNINNTVNDIYSTGYGLDYSILLKAKFLYIKIGTTLFNDEPMPSFEEMNFPKTNWSPISSSLFHTDMGLNIPVVDTRNWDMDIRLGFGAYYYNSSNSNLEKYASNNNLYYKDKWSKDYYFSNLINDWSTKPELSMGFLAEAGVNVNYKIKDFLFGVHYTIDTVAIKKEEGVFDAYIPFYSSKSYYESIYGFSHEILKTSQIGLTLGYQFN